MAVPTAYTQTEVEQFMETVLGDTASQLGWSATNGDFTEPVNSVLYILDEDDFSWVNTRAEALKVRTVARVEAWRAAMYYTAHESSFSAGAPGTGQTERTSIHRQCEKMFQLALAEMEERFPTLGSGSRQVTKFSTNFALDPYEDTDVTDEWWYPFYGN